MELIIILVAFLAFIIFSNKKRANAAKQLEASVVVGAKVVLLGGIMGTVTAIHEDSVIVETTPGTKIEFVKAAVRSVVAPTLDEKPKTEKAAPASKKPAPATKKPSPAIKKTTSKTTAK